MLIFFFYYLLLIYLYEQQTTCVYAKTKKWDRIVLFSIPLIFPNDTRPGVELQEIGEYFCCESLGNNQAWILFLLAHDWKIFMTPFFHWHDSLIQSERHLLYSFSAHFRNWENRGPDLKMGRKKGSRREGWKGAEQTECRAATCWFPAVHSGFNCPGEAPASFLVRWVRGNSSVHFYTGQAGVCGNTTLVKSVVKIR